MGRERGRGEGTEGECEDDGSEEEGEEEGKEDGCDDSVSIEFVITPDGSDFEARTVLTPVIVGSIGLGITKVDDDDNLGGQDSGRGRGSKLSKRYHENPPGSIMNIEGVGILGVELEASSIGG